MDNKRIATIIKDIRKKNNLTQNDLAESLGVTYQAVSKWEREINIPDISVLKIICDKYNYDINDLLDTKKERKVNKLYILFIFVISILAIVCGYLIFSKDDFNLFPITSVCKEYIVSGSIAYNKDKTLIVIQDIDYCKEDNKIYKSIECKLYKEENNKITLIDSFRKENDITIKEYMKLVYFNADSKKDDCNYLKNTSFKLTVIFETEDGTSFSHDVPLEFNSVCSK